MTTRPSATGIAEPTSDEWISVPRPSEIALRQEIASLIHSRLRTRAVLAESAAAEAGVPVRVRSLIKRLVNEIEETRQEVLGDPSTGSISEVLQRQAASFEGAPDIRFRSLPAFELHPMDHDLVITVMLDLVTNAHAAGAENVTVEATHDAATSTLSMVFEDDGTGLAEAPWGQPDDPDRSTYILDQILRRRGGGLSLLPSTSGATVRAEWKVSA